MSEVGRGRERQLGLDGWMTYKQIHWVMDK